MSHTFTIALNNTGLQPHEISSVQFTMSGNILNQGQAALQVLHFLQIALNNKTVGAGVFV